MIGVDIRYDLNALFDTVFGIKHYAVPGESPEENYERLSQYGTPVLTAITFEGKEYQVYDKNGEIITQSFGDMELPVATLVSISRKKQIIKTPTPTGTVKELYGFGDWEIDVNGFCIPDTAQPQGLFSPQQQADALKDWEKIADAVRIKGGLMIHKDIHDIVIQDFATWQLKGSPNVIPFRMKWISDQPVELLLV